MERRRNVILTILVCGALGGITWVKLNHAPVAEVRRLQESAADDPLTVSTDGGFVGSSACRECHTPQYASWHRSYHRTMTQHASPKTVLAPFDGEQLDFEGQLYRLHRDGDQFFVSAGTPDSLQPAISYSDRAARREVVMTTGSHHIQVYWISDPVSKLLIEFPFYYHLAEKRWILRDDTMLHPPDQPQIPSVWNDRCIKCHSVNGVPGLNPATGKLSTHVAEIGIACEACHGPGHDHVALRRDSSAHSPSSTPDATIVNPQHLNAKAATQVCGRCHSATQPFDAQDYLQNGLAFRPGDDLHAFVKLNRFDPTQQRPASASGTFVENYPIDGYWKDGTCRVGGDEYNALIESPCYQEGVMSCLSCHSMHQSDPNDQLAAHAIDNRACTQCHKDSEFNEQLSSHTHHAAQSSGSLCYNCHMPHTSYALLKGIRNHRISRPSVLDSVRSGKPNACNLCHLDETLRWTSNHLTDWYGTESPSLNHDEESIAASVLWLYKGDAALRIIAAWHMGWAPALAASGDDWQAPLLASLLDDPYSAIRFVTFQSIRSLTGFEDFKYDFLGTPESRRRAVSSARDVWAADSDASGQNSRDKTNRSAVLQNEDRELQASEVARLQSQRNDQPVSIAE